MNLVDISQKAEPKYTKILSNLIFSYISSIIFYDKTYLDSALWFILIWKPTQLVQTLTNRMLTKKGKCPVLRANTKVHQLIKYAKISYFVAFLVFCKFLCSTYRNDLSRGTPRSSKSTSYVSSILFVENLNILVHSVQ